MLPKALGLAVLMVVLTYVCPLVVGVGADRVADHRKYAAGVCSECRLSG